MAELKPCPFCGCHDYGVHLQKLYYENDNYTKYKVMCEDCGEEVGEFATPERSIEAWNRRVSDVHSGQRTEKRD